MVVESGVFVIESGSVWVAGVYFWHKIDFEAERFTYWIRKEG